MMCKLEINAMDAILRYILMALEYAPKAPEAAKCGSATLPHAQFLTCPFFSAPTMIFSSYGHTDTQSS